MGKRRATRSREELVTLLSEQRAALAASCENYDKGNEWEASRLATTVFTLVHDGGPIVSLLTQLGLRSSLRFLSSGRVKTEPGLIAALPPLVEFVAKDGQPGKFIPRFNRLHSSGAKRLQFHKWWDEAIYKDFRYGVELTRKRLVFALRHQDGGSHIGELSDRAYVYFRSGGGWFGGVGGGAPTAMVTGASATMRQIAWEMTETLKDVDGLP